MENPLKMADLGVPFIFGNIHILKNMSKNHQPTYSPKNFQSSDIGSWLVNLPPPERTNPRNEGLLRPYYGKPIANNS